MAKASVPFRIKTVTLALGLAVVLGACTPHSAKISDTTQKAQSGSNTTTSGSSSGGGNGEFYGGKPGVGRYLRYLPNNLCGPSVTNLGEIEITETGIRARIVDPNDCSVRERVLSASDMQNGYYDPQGKIAFEDGIYKLDGSTGANEAWCRAGWNAPDTSLEVSVTADYRNQKFVAAMSSRLSPLPSDEVERTVDLTSRIRYRGERLKLDINTDSFNSVTGMFESEVELENVAFESKLYCRLGGELDLHNLKKPY